MAKANGNSQSESMKKTASSATIARPNALMAKTAPIGAGRTLEEVPEQWPQDRERGEREHQVQGDVLPGFGRRNREEQRAGEGNRKEGVSGDRRRVRFRQPPKPLAPPAEQQRQPALGPARSTAGPRPGGGLLR